MDAKTDKQIDADSIGYIQIRTVIQIIRTKLSTSVAVVANSSLLQVSLNRQVELRRSIRDLTTNSLKKITRVPICTAWERVPKMVQCPCFHNVNMSLAILLVI